MKLRLFFESRSKAFWSVTGVFLLILIGFADHYSGFEVSVTLFYLLPIGICAWFVSGRMGLVISAASALTWLVADYSSGLTYSSNSIFIWNTLIRLGFFVVVSFLLSTVRKDYVINQQFARNDYVTGAASVRFFYDLAQTEVDRSIKSRRPFTLAYLDMDNFKQVNDRFGHSTGDRVLREVAEGIRVQIRSTDVVARLGGDEFAVLLMDTDQENARRVMTRIHDGLEGKMRQEGWGVTFSIGVVTFKNTPKTVDEVIRIADQAMYSVKNSSKSGVNYQLFA
jgi:diguanylate cyclase (GGDEF)-like protein